MLGKIIIFKLTAAFTRGERARFYRRFYGYVDRSNHGRYIHEKPLKAQEVEDAPIATAYEPLIPYL